MKKILSYQLSVKRIALLSLSYLILFSTPVFSAVNPNFKGITINGSSVSANSFIDLPMTSLTSFQVGVTYSNGGLTSSKVNGLTISFPDWTSSGYKSYVSYNYNSASEFDATYGVYFGSEAGGGDGYANYVMVEASDPDWNYLENNELVVNVTPTSYGQFRIYFRCAMGGADWSNTVYDPTSGVTDCLGYYSYYLYINIYKPNSAPSQPLNPYPNDGESNVSIGSYLDWSNSSDPDGDNVDYEVYFGTDATPDAGEYKGIATGSSYSGVSLEYDLHYYWKVIAFDGNGGTTSSDVWDFYTQSKPNTTPTITIESPTNPVTEKTNTSISFTASSYDADGAGDLDRIYWYVGTNLEGSTDWTANLLNPRDNSFSYSFDAPGTYTVSAVVYDQSGATAQVTWTVYITNTAPTITIKSPTNPVTEKTNTSISFTASSYDADGAGDLDMIYWYVGTNLEGSTDWTSNLLNPRDNSFSHSFDTPGTYTVRAVVYDQSGATAQVTWTVYITNTTPTITIKSPTNPVTEKTNTSISFTASSYDADGSGDLDRIVWYVDDVQEDETDWIANLLNPRDNSFSRSFDTPGTYTVRAVVYDQSGASAQTSWSVTITNTVPTITIKSPTNPVTEKTNTSISFTASSYDADGAGDLDRIYWYVGTNLEGSTDWTANLLNPRDNSFSHSFDTPGTYTVRAVVYDQSGASAQTSWSVTITNTVPTITIKSPTNPVTEKTNTSISFTASSYDADGSGDLDRIVWYVGDIQEDETDWIANLLNPRDNSFSHSFDTPGTYTVRAVVYDQSGATAQVTWTVYITNTAPTITIKSPTNPVTEKTNTSISFTASSYDADGAGDLDRIYWYVGTSLEGSTDWTANLLNPRDNSFSHSFDTPGTYTVSAVVYDQSGATAQVTWTVYITNTAPTITIKSPTNPVTEKTNTSISFTASSYDADGAGDLDMIYWYVDDVQEDETDWIANLLNPRDNSFSHSFDTPGTYTVRAEVYDQSGASAQTSWSVTITNTVPTITIKSPTNPVTEKTNTSISFTASSYDADGAGDLDRIYWYVGTSLEGSTDWTANLLNPRDNSFSHSFDTPGTYTVSAVVYDQSGATAQVTWTVYITNTAPTITIKSPTNPVTEKTNTSISFTASSYDADGSGDLDRIVWYVDDVQEDETDWIANLLNPRDNSFSHSFDTPGTYTVRAVVYDQSGASAQTSWSVTITNTVPTITIKSPTNPVTEKTNTSISFTASSYDADGAGDLDRIYWYVGTNLEGSTDWTANLLNPRDNSFSHSFDTPGTYTVRAVVYDQSGASAQTSWSVTITNTVPTITIKSPTNPVTEKTNTSISFTASSYDADGAGDLDRIYWYVGDVQEDETDWIANLLNPRDNSFSHSFDTPGTYTVRAVVYDQSGASAQTNWSVTINDSEEILFANWLNSNMQVIEDVEVAACSVVYLQIRTIGYATGSRFNLTIQERDNFILNGDDYIETIVVEVDENGIGTGAWNTIYSYKNLADESLKSSQASLPDSDSHPDYFFEVQEVSGSGILKSSGYIEVVDRSNPDSPSLVYPQINEEINILNDREAIEFSWEINQGEICKAEVDKYNIQIATDESFNNIIESDVISGLDKTFTLNHGTYFWRVGARSITGYPLDWNDANWSSVNRLYVKYVAQDVIVIDELSSTPIGNRQPLLLVHGWQPKGMPADYGGAIWDNFITYFNSNSDLLEKYKLYKVKYLSNLVSVEELGDRLKREIDELELNGISIVAHSMGGLVSRAFMDSDVGGTKGGELVDLLITLGTPHHGSPMANGPVRYSDEFSLLSKVFHEFDMLLFGSIYKYPDYDQHNRLDLHWDNFNAIFPYDQYPDERNDWLNQMNSNTEYDHKIITYCASWDGSNYIMDNTGAYLIGLQIMTDMGVIKANPGLVVNDGIVPLSSARFEGHTTKASRFFSPYNHTRIAEGNEGKNDILFATLKSDLLFNAISLMAIFPDNFVDLGKIQVTETSMKSIQIFNSGTSQLRISGVSLEGANSDQYRLSDIITPLSISPGGSVNIEILFKPSSVGVKTANIRLLNDSDNFGPETEIGILGEAVEEPLKIVEFSPLISMDFGVSSVNNPVTKILLISNSGESAIAISDVMVEGPDADEFIILSPVSKTFDIPVGATQEVVVRFSPTTEGGKTATLSIGNNSDNAAPVKSISLSGYGTAEATRILAVSPDVSCDFGMVTNGGQITKSFLLTNQGSVTLSITDIGITGTHATQFSVVSPASTSFEIPSGAAQEVVVRFSPTTEGRKTATLSIGNSSDNAAPVKSVSLSGYGTAEATRILTVSPNVSCDFGVVTNGGHMTKSFLLTNQGSSTLSITELGITGTHATQFSVVSPASTSFEIPSGTTQEVVVRFSPTTEGGKTATLSIGNSSDNAAPVKSISLSGYGTAEATRILVVSPDLSCDFGVVTEGGHMTKSFLLSNQGSATLSITDIGITGTYATPFSVVSPASTSFEIPSGTTQEVVVRFSPTTEGGKTATLSIGNNSDNAAPVKSISLSGYGTAEATRTLAVSPDVSCDFGMVTNGGHMTKSFLLTNQGSTTLSITDIGITGTHATQFSVVSPASTSFEIPSGTTQEVVVRFSPTTEGGKTATLSIGNSSDNAAPVKSISLSGYGTAEATRILAVSPDVSCDFGVVTEGGHMTKSFLLSNRGSATLSITDIGITGTHATQFSVVSPASTSFEIPSGTTQEVVVRFSPTTEGGKTATLSIGNSSDNAAPVKSISLSGYGTVEATRILAVSPDVSCDFGVVTEGGHMTKSFLLSNRGSATLSITDIGITGTHATQFSVVSPASTSFEIPSGTTQEVVVRFSPTTEGGKTATLSIGNSSDNAAPVKSISLSGYGTAEATRILAVSPDVSCDFGVVTEGGHMTKSFLLSNRGSATLSITDIGITGTHATQFSILSPASTTFEIPSGVTQEVVVRFSPTAEGGKTATLSIGNSSDNAAPVKPISLSGYGTVEATRILLISPNVSYDYGKVSKNGQVIKSFQLSNQGTSSISISGISISGSDADQFSILSPVSTTLEIPAWSAQEVIVLFSPTSEGGKTATLSISNNSDNTGPIHIISLSGLGINEATKILTINPDISYDFGVMTINGQLTKSYLLSNQGTSNLTISDMDITGTYADQFSIVSPSTRTFDLLPGSSQEIQLRFSPTSVGGKTATLVITNNSDNAGPIKSLSLSGQGTDEPVGILSVYPDYIIDFGIVTAENQVSRYFQLSNQGTDVINVSGITIAGADKDQFSIVTPDNKSFDIYPGLSNELVVLFNPTSNGGKTATLLISNTSDNAGPYKSINLSGIGDGFTTVDQTFIANQITLYPNPASNRIYLRSSKDLVNGLDIMVYDNTGKLVFVTEMESLKGSEQLEIDISTYDYGTYFIQIVNAEDRIIKKFIKQ